MEGLVESKTAMNPILYRMNTIEFLDSVSRDLRYAGRALRRNPTVTVVVVLTLAVGLALFCLRYLIPEDRWPDGAARLSFWSLNIGLAWMSFATLFPLGMLQLYESVNSGYYEARTLEFLTNDTNALIEWMRLPGDVLFIAGGVVPLLYITWLGIRHTVPRVALEQPEVLFTEITEPVGVREPGA